MDASRCRRNGATSRASARSNSRRRCTSSDPMGPAAGHRRGGSARMLTFGGGRVEISATTLLPPISLSSANRPSDRSTSLATRRPDALSIVFEVSWCALHENGTSRSRPQSSQRNRAGEPATLKKVPELLFDKAGRPSPSRRLAACMRKVSKCSCTIWYSALCAGCRGSYLVEGWAIGGRYAGGMPARGPTQSA